MFAALAAPAFPVARLQLTCEPFAEASEEDVGKWSSLNSQARNALGCQFAAMVLGW